MSRNTESKAFTTRRKKALLDIRGERLNFEEMVQRSKIGNAQIDEQFVADVRQRLDELEQRAHINSISWSELDELVYDAERQGQLRAYLCP